MPDWVDWIVMGVLTTISVGACIFYFFKIREFKKLLFKEKEKTQEEWIKEAKQKYCFEINEKIDELNSIENKITEKENEIKKIEKEISEKKEFNSSLLQIREEELNRIIKEKEEKLQFKYEKEEERLKIQLQQEINEWALSAQEAANFQNNISLNAYAAQRAKEQAELEVLENEIKEYKLKRDAINKEILRARAIEEKQDFYRIQIPDDSICDVNLLNEIRPRLSKVDLLNKLIYDNYISKPAKEMIKRVLKGEDPTGIYKVTNIETNEIYIGKSTSIGSRWINHIKSAYGLEGVADSQFQRALKKYGVNNFTWEVIEKTEKDKLTEREKYYIDFYNTMEYGYNMRRG